MSTESFQLPESGIFVNGEELVRRKDADTVLAAHPLSDILEVEIIKKTDWGCLASGLIVGACTVPAVQSHTWEGYATGAFTALLFLASLFSISNRRLKLRLRQGQVVYELKESEGDCQGFLLSLKSVLEHRRRG